MSRATVALVGRPNVGKSTLFNRIVGARHAIVDDRPGVTRDRNFGSAAWAGHTFWLVDTGGWTADPQDPISTGIRAQVEQAVAESDVIALVVNTQDGVHPADLEIAQLLRPIAERVVVVANKADDLPDTLSHHAFHELGLGHPHPVSAATGKGSGDLLDHIVALLAPRPTVEEDESIIHVAVVGRPNVGKSSVSNRLLGQERSIVAPESGTTRDAVDSPLRYHDRTLNFIDTAGLRKRSKVKDDIEFYSTLRTRRAIERAHVCVVVVDAMSGVEGQDIRIAELAWEQGTGLIIAVNKWDLVDKTTQTAESGRREVVSRVPFFDRVPFVYVSAVTGLRVRKLLDLIVEVATARIARVNTAAVNEVLRKLVARNQPPNHRGRELKLYYASQIGVGPPTFAIVTNDPEGIPDSYRRYLVNGLHDAFGFVGCPIRLRFRRKRGTVTR